MEVTVDFSNLAPLPLEPVYQGWSEMLMWIGHGGKWEHNASLTARVLVKTLTEIT